MRAAVPLHVQPEVWAAGGSEGDRVVVPGVAADQDREAVRSFDADAGLTPMLAAAAARGGRQQLAQLVEWQALCLLHAALQLGQLLPEGGNELPGAAEPLLQSPGPVVERLGGRHGILTRLEPDGHVLAAETWQNDLRSGPGSRPVSEQQIRLLPQFGGSRGSLLQPVDIAEAAPEQLQPALTFAPDLSEQPGAFRTFPPRCRLGSGVAVRSQEGRRVSQQLRQGFGQQRKLPVGHLFVLRQTTAAADRKSVLQG